MRTPIGAPAALAAAAAFLAGGVAAQAAARPGLEAPMTLELDASEAPRKILRARLTVPAREGALRLVYPRWIPGEHGPTGPLADLAGLAVSAAGRALPWRRDPIDLDVFECQVPTGVDAVEVRLDLLMAPSGEQGFSKGSSSSARLAVLNWNQVLLYPAGAGAGDLLVKSSLTLPEGWTLATALPVASRGARSTAFEAVTLERLIDSPVLCGRHVREIPVGPPGPPRHVVALAADSPEALEAPEPLRRAWDALAREALRMFGAHHYASYTFLVALGDGLAHFGLEHHESSDNRVPERTLLEEDLRRSHATLLPHEFVHSWNGKHRRPADMMSADYQRPLRTRLLWVYEGLTQYLGLLLTARSGLWTPEEFRDRLAMIAEWASAQSGRTWRPLEDTAVSAQILFPSRRDWRAWRRGTDFYDEAVLIWLDADTLIRTQTRGRRSLEDFVRRFHGGQSGPAEVLPYTFDDLVESLNQVHSHDWRFFFERRLTSTDAAPPLEGLTRAGWRLGASESPSHLLKAYDERDEQISLTLSLGLVLKKDGKVKDVVPGRSADRAGVGPGMTLVAINGRRWSEPVLRDAVAATGRGGTRLDLLLESDQFIRTHTLDYRGGARYPALEPIPGSTDLLSEMTRSGD